MTVEQRALDAASVTLRGRHLIEASAGTGKTWTIALLFVRLVVEEGLDVEQILVVTYTTAAAAELRERLRGRLVEAERALTDGTTEAALRALVERWGQRPGADEARRRLRAAIGGFDRAGVSTIHSFCARSLAEQAFESGTTFDVPLETSGDDRLDRIARTFWVEALRSAPPVWVGWVTENTPWKAVMGVVRAASSGSVVFRPPDPGDAPIGAAIDALAAAWGDAAAALADGGEAALKGLVGHKGLDGRRYGAKNMPSLLAKLESLLGAGPHVAWDGKEAEAVNRLAASTLEASAARKGVAAPRHALFDALERLASAWRAAVVDVEAARVHLLYRLLDVLPERLGVAQARRPAWSFDELLTRLGAALDGPSGAELAGVLAQRFPVALIDEFQDTDPVQYRIFDTIYRGRGRALFLIGDPKQAIYAFRGADLDTYLLAGRSADASWTLGTNHRTDAPLVRDVLRLFEADDAFLDPRVRAVEVGARHPVRLEDPSGGAPLELLMVAGGPRVRALVDAAADEVVRLLGAGLTLDGRPLGPGDVAVLVARHAEADAVQRALIRRGVPAVRYGRQPVLQTEEAAAVALLLEAVAHPTDGRRLRALLLSPIGGCDAADVLGLGDDEELAWFERLAVWRRLWGQRGFMRMFHAMLHATDAPARILSVDGGERRLTNLRHVAERLHAAEAEARLGPDGLVRWLAAQRAGMGEADEAAEVRLESDARAVQVVTMHASKGLEYPVTVVLGLHAEASPDKHLPRFHDPSTGALTIDLGVPAADESVRLATAEAEAERLRLAYVALTRAKHRAVLVWGRVGGNRAAWHEGPLARLCGLLPLVQARLAKDWSDEDLARALEDSVGWLAQRWVAVEEPKRWEVEVARAEPRPVWQPTRRLHRAVRFTSFSGLVAAGVLADADRDHDARPAAARRVTDGPSELPLAGFPRGPEAGTAVHEILEGRDFASLLSVECVPGLAAELTRRGIDGPTHATALQAGLAATLNTPLGDDGWRLIDLPRGDRLDELGFTLPAGSEAKPLTASGLADGLRLHDDPAFVDRFAPRIARLGFGQIRAMLKGYIDVVWRRDGRWYVADYKTNHRGPDPDGYDAEGLAEEMVHGDYVLQAGLYSVAVHRFLRQRLASYRYAEHFGGVHYLFLRGMRPETGASRGVFSFRPSEAWITAWDELLGGGER